jgi:hypothetical protein
VVGVDKTVFYPVAGGKRKINGKNHDSLLGFATGGVFMKTYSLQHFIDGEKHRLIGLFTSKEKAVDAVTLLSDKQGFKTASKLKKALNDSFNNGFVIDKYVIDELVFKSVTPKAQIKKKQKVFMLEHHHTKRGGIISDAIIGITSCEKDAKHIAMQLKKRPEYKDAGEILPTHTIGNGFVINQIELDFIDWKEGFIA